MQKSISVTYLFKRVFQKDNRLSLILCTALSFLYSILFITMGQFYEHNSLSFLTGSKDLLALSLVKALAFTLVLGFGLSLLSVSIKDRLLPAAKKVNKPVILFFASFVIILLAYLPWLLLGYPGSTNPDAELQLRMFFGETPMSNWQPVLSNYLIGGCFALGRELVNPNFGFFVYEIFQTLAAATVISLAVYKLRKKALPLPFCIAIIAYFVLLPMYGSFAQWVEKGFIFAVVFLLQTIILMEIIDKKECGIPDMIVLIIVSLVCSFLRNNGIYAVVPSVIALVFYLKKQSRLRAAIALASILFVYLISVKEVYPAVGIAGTSVSESIGFTFQQVARYVNTYPEEVTDYEKEVLSQSFQDYDNLKLYNPVINDPVKIYYNHSNPEEYFKVWFKMFFKHPNAYIAAYLNGSYGYLAPVHPETSAYIMLHYDEYLTSLGIYHTMPQENYDIFANVLSLSRTLPVVKYISSPGLYTWLLGIMLLMLLLHKKGGAIIALIPSIVTVMVCTISPLACAMRYAIPYVMCTPILMGWCYTLFQKQPHD